MRRMVAAASVLAVVLGWSVTARTSVCLQGVGLLTKGISAGVATGAAVPTFFAPNGDISYFGGITSAGRPSPARSGRPGFVVGGTYRGRWGEWGYRTDWHGQQQGFDCRPWVYTLVTGAATYRLLDSETSAVTASLGGGFAFGGGPTLDVGLSVEKTLYSLIGLEGRFRYLPNPRFAALRGPGIAHLFRATGRVELPVASAVRPFVGVSAGTNGDIGTLGSYQLMSGAYVSGLVGFRASWSS